MAVQVIESRVSVAAGRAGDTLRPMTERLRRAAWFWVAGAVLFAIALPLFLISGSVRIVSTSTLLYEWDFNRYNIEQVTGLSRTQLRRGSDGLIDYFGNDAEFIDTQVDFGTGDVPLYKEREILHLRDVKSLFQLINNVEKGAFGFVVAFLVLGIAVRGWSFLPLLRRTMIFSGIGTVLLVATVGIAVAVAFDQVFLQFHLLSFSNDFWRLNPRTHYLIRMFPENFFLDATVAITAFVVVEFALVFGAVWLFARKARRRLSPGGSGS